MIEQIKVFVEAYHGWLIGGSLAMLVMSVFVVEILITRMQPDYFLDERDESKSIKETHPVLRWTGKILKNLVGGFLLVCGLILSIPLVPGQGLLTVLIALVIMDFPGKRKLELWLIRRKPIHWAVWKIREKAGKEPLRLPPEKVKGPAGPALEPVAPPPQPRRR